MEAGADIIETNTYQASVQGFQEHLGLNEDNALEVGVFINGSALKIREGNLYKYFDV